MKTRGYHFNAPRIGDNDSSWINVVFKDIRSAFNTALDHGATQIQELVKMPEMGISNAIFKDPSGHLWMLHQING